MINHGFRAAILMLLTLLLSSYHFCAYAQEERTTAFTFHFKSNKAVIDPSYMGNRQVLNIMSRMITPENAQFIESIAIYGFASPEGLASSNYAQAIKRAEALSQYVQTHYPSVPKNKITTSGGGINWSGLRSLVVADSHTPNHEQILRIIDEPIEGNLIDQSEIRSKKLKTLGASTWNYLLDKHFSKLRTTELIVAQRVPTMFEPTSTAQQAMISSPIPSLDSELKVISSQLQNLNKTITLLEQADVSRITQSRLWDADDQIMRISNRLEQAQMQVNKLGAGRRKIQEELNLKAEVLEVLIARNDLIKEKSRKPLPDVVDSDITSITTEKIVFEKKPLFAVKTNLLFDAASMLNVELEVPIGTRWSIAGEWIFPWWLWESKQHALQLLSGNVEGRYWLGNRTDKSLLTGWFAGVYVGGGYYDLEWNKKGYQGEFFIAAGVSGGYSHTITKSKNWRMEYALGLGYMQTNYRHYEASFSNIDNRWHLFKQHSGRLTWLGPTRLKLSLVWMLNRKVQKGYSK